MVEVVAEDEGGPWNGGVGTKGEGDAVLVGFVGGGGEVGGCGWGIWRQA